MKIRRASSVSTALLSVLVMTFTMGCGTKTADVVTPPGSTTPAPTGTATPSATAPASVPAVAKPVASAGCGTSKTGAVDNENRTLTINGHERFYLLTTPAAHDGHTPLSVVFDFHGLVEGAQVHTKMSNFGALAKTEGFVVVTPNGQGVPLHWDTVAEHDPNEDLAFVDAMIEQLGADLCIDTSRIYSTGLSDGSIMTSLLLCVRSEKFAAAAPVAGLQMPKGCAPKRKVPILTFHGTADPILKFDGTVDISILVGKKPGEATTTTVAPDLNGPGYPANVAAWAKLNGCEDKAVDTKTSESVIHRVYSCPANADVEFDIIVGGGHSWPGSEFSKTIEAVVGPTSFEIDATKEAWKFFQRFHLPA